MSRFVRLVTVAIAVVSSQTLAATHSGQAAGPSIADPEWLRAPGTGARGESATRPRGGRRR